VDDPDTQISGVFCPAPGARASVFSIISTFSNVKKRKMSFILTSQEFNHHLHQNFPPNFGKTKKNVAIS